MGRHDLTDVQWAKPAPLLPVGRKPGRPPVRSKRQLMDGIRRRTRAGAPWRDVPESNRPRNRCRWSSRPGSARTRPDKVRADKAYGSRANRAYRAGRGRQRVAVTNTFETPPGRCYRPADL
ncbi:transposase [Streptomyces olivaceus]|uniref:transposase n=1 Tax=Streptomyces olivaceus TaxID=47716 RepID=UPI0036B4CA65